MVKCLFDIALAPVAYPHTRIPAYPHAARRTPPLILTSHAFQLEQANVGSCGGCRDPCRCHPNTAAIARRMADLGDSYPARLERANARTSWLVDPFAALLVFGAQLGGIELSLRET